MVLYSCYSDSTSAAPRFEVLVVLAARGSEALSRRIFQLRILDFLAHELDLEYSVRTARRLDPTVMDVGRFQISQRALGCVS